jgi:teichoic acid transport system ATP-binding protein
MEYAVRLRNVIKRYSMSNSKKDILLSVFSNYKSQQEFYAIDDITIDIKKGEVVGLLGVNGSGKSTLLKIISGISTATSGDVEISGEVALLAVGAGMDLNLTGIENIEQKCILLGFSDNQINEMTKDIIEFSELGPFIHRPVRSYSSGMRSRLGFAISINVDPDILIIDEALAVGDAAFVDKCMKKINEFKEKGKTIFYVAHSSGQIKKFCNKAIWMEFGKVKEYGDVYSVSKHYEEFLDIYKSMSPDEKTEFNLQKKIIVTNNKTSKNYIRLKQSLTGEIKYVNKGYSFTSLFLMFLPSIFKGYYTPLFHYILYFLITKIFLNSNFTINLIFIVLYPYFINKIYIKYLLKRKGYIIE